MANSFDRGMDDFYSGKEPKGDPGLEYLQGYGYAESLFEEDIRQQEDNREYSQYEEQNEEEEQK